MQIRVANRQDEPLIRAIVFQSLEEIGIQSDLETQDRDLRNIEHNYFWYDGLCIVAEDNGQIIGVLAARRRQGEEAILELLRLVVTAGARKRGAARALVKTMLFFANNMEYKTIVLGGRFEQLKQLDDEILKRLGFVQAEQGWQISVCSSEKTAVLKNNS